VRWEANLDPLSYDVYLKKNQGAQPQPALSPDVATNLTRVKQRAGWLTPQTQLALAKANATDEVIDAAGRLQAKQIAEAQVSQPPRALPTQIYDNIKAVSRWGTAALNFLPESVQGAAAQLFDKNDDIDGWFIQTSLGTMIENPELRGEGFFLSEEGMKKQAERARRYRGTINGSAWTVGRGAANLVNLQPNTKPYNILSGVLDAMVLIKTDPTGPLTKAYKAFTAPKYMVPLLTKGALAQEAAALADEAGVATNLAGVTVEGKKFIRFWNENPRAKQLVDYLTTETSPVKILERFEGRLDNEVVAALADAQTGDEVIDALAGGWTMEDGSLFRDVRRYQKSVISPSRRIGEIVQRIPFADGIRKSRWFQTMPENTIVINGTDEDNRKGALNIIRFLRAAGVDDAKVEAIGGEAIRNLAQGTTAAGKKRVLNTFNGAVRAALTANGMDVELADDMIKKANGGIDNLRQYMLNRQGMPTDNKMYSFIANKNLDYLPTEEIESLIEALGNPKNLQISGPLQLSELLNRVHFLPDVQQIRRATSNPWLSRLTKVRGASKTALREFTVIKPEMKDQYDQAVSRLSAIADQYPKKSTMPQTVAEEVASLQKTVQDARTVVKRRVNTGEQRFAIEAIDRIQNEVWKPLALATGGYVVRNGFDAQVRMAFAGLNSALTHPFQYLMLVLGQAERRTIQGAVTISYAQTGRKAPVVWNRIVNGTSRLLGGDKLEMIAEANLSEIEQAMRQNLRFGMREQGLDAVGAADHLQKTNAWARASRGDVNGMQFHTDGVLNNVALINGDELDRLAAEHLAGGGTEDGLVARLVAYAKSKKEILEDIEDMYYGGGEGFTVVNPDNALTAKQKGFVPFSQMRTDDLDIFLGQHMRRVVLGNVQVQTGNLPDVQFMAAFNQIPLTTIKKGVHVRVPTVERAVGELTIVGGAGKDDGIHRIGSLVQIGEDRVGVVTSFRDEEGRVIVDAFGDGVIEFEGKKFATVVPVTGELAAGPQSQGVDASRRIVQSLPLWDETTKTGLPQVVKREIMERKEEKNGLTAAFDKSINWFFNEIAGKASNILDRSPTFRQYYAQIIAEQADMLSPEEAEKLLKQISDNAKALGIGEAQYLGSKKTLEVLKASTMTRGTATAEELDEYARFMAVQQTKELLYDASNKSNLEDALRIIMPFAPAWREVLGTYIGFLKGNPVNTVRSFQRVYSGALGADYDNDGRGFFYRDPTTNQMMFAFPGSGTLAKLLTGINAPLEAPVKRLSQGINAYPSLGPMMQVAASQLPDAPQLDAVKDFLLPYGEKGVISGFNPIPQWTVKFAEAIKADTGKLDNVFGNTYIETLRALSASGDYDLDDPNSTNQLYKDAKAKARILTLMRASSQFLGPTAGATEFVIPTKEGDQFVSALVKEFYDLQAKDYDTAVPKFLELYGDEVTLYVASKTRSLQEGLEATEEFSDWERRNGDLLAQYENTAAYLAPAGSEFNFTVWQRQLQQGKRERLTDREVVAIAQQRIGSAKYRAARRLVGPYPNEEQQNILRTYREYLHKQYPGFPLKAEFTVGKFENDVEELRNLVADPRVAENPTAKAVSEYLEYLDQAVGTYVSRGGQPSGFATAKSAAPLRSAMASIGEALAQREPGFSRVWQRLLAQQVED
jgi:energy-coupling factor transporter ATP-binding protein EcfA2